MEEASTVASRGMVRFEGAGHKPPPQIGPNNGTGRALAGEKEAKGG